VIEQKGSDEDNDIKATLVGIDAEWGSSGNIALLQLSVRHVRSKEVVEIENVEGDIDRWRFVDANAIK